MASADYDDRDREERRDESSSKQGVRRECDFPPYSRLFLVCARHHSVDDLKRYFDPFGDIEDVWIIRDRNSKESRGVAYVKFAKASEAALALEEMNGKSLGSETKPIKVMMANSRSSGSSRDIDLSEELARLFIITPKTVSEDDIRKSFDEYGDIDYINIVRDRQSGNPKGFAYVKYHKASNALLALENSDRKFKAVLAEPKISKINRDRERERERDRDRDREYNNPHSHGGGYNDPYQSYASSVYGKSDNRRDRMRESERAYTLSHQNNDPYQNYAASVYSAQSGKSGVALPDLFSVSQRLEIMAESTVTQDQLTRLFDLVPGLEYCQLNYDYGSASNKAIGYVRYSTTASAMYAKEKLNRFEYPPGYRITVKYTNDDPGASKEGSSHSNNAGISSLLGTAPSSGFQQGGGSQQRYNESTSCTVTLPAPQPMAAHGIDTAERLFVVCHPQPPQPHQLRDVFSRFGNLIDVFMLGHKNYGYAKYSDKESAKLAMETLHGQEVGGMRLKVLPAEPQESRKRQKTGP